VASHAHSARPAASGDAVRIADVFEGIGALAETAAQGRPLDPDDLARLADAAARARGELAAFQAQALLEERLPSAQNEISATRLHTEDAANRILAAAEAILCADAGDGEAYRADVEQHALDILQACEFQDITGQRLEKASRRLAQIEQRADRLVAALGLEDSDAAPEEERLEAQRAEELLLHGPAAPESAQDQASVDEAFSQADIDALFD